MRTQRTIGIVVIACLVVGLTTVAWLIGWLGVGPALGLVAVAIAAWDSIDGFRQAWIRSRS